VNKLPPLYTDPAFNVRKHVGAELLGGMCRYGDRGECAGHVAWLE
jgi:hypothetical protein